MKAVIRTIEYYLPEAVLANEELAALYPEWTAARIEEKLGVRQRHIAAADECASDLAVQAAERLFSKAGIEKSSIDYILFCTQSPDYYLPTSACIIQKRLGLSCALGAIDFNLGCSGYVYGLGLAKGLIESGQAANVLLLTADTYSKYIDPQDKSTRTLFGDAATATLVLGVESETDLIGPFVYGTDGEGAENLMVKAGGARQGCSLNKPEAGDQVPCLYMNGQEIFTFTLSAVPQAINSLLEKSGLSADQIDYYVFHQANVFMLEGLRRALKIPKEKFVISMRDTGNTVSSTIPIALKNTGFAPGSTLMLVGFGVGYSWGATLIKWP